MSNCCAVWRITVLNVSTRADCSSLIRLGGIVLRTGTTPMSIEVCTISRKFAAYWSGDPLPESFVPTMINATAGLTCLYSHTRGESFPHNCGDEKPGISSVNADQPPPAARDWFTNGF